MAASRRGVTLLEMMIVLSLFSFMAYCVMSLVNSSMVLTAHSESWAGLTEWGQQGVNRISEDLPATRRIFNDDLRGNLYLAALEPPVTHPVLGGIHLPITKDPGTFHADVVGAEQTGNCLLLCKQQPIFATVLLSGVTRRVDVYTIVFFYPSPVARPMGPYARSLILARWESIEFADYGELMSLTASDRAEVVSSLRTVRGVTWLWDVSKDPNQAFYGTNVFGIVDAVPTATFKPPGASNQNLIPHLGLGFASLAWNRTNATWIPQRVPMYAIANAVGDGFPHGFEVQVIGPTGSRTILLRLTLARYVQIDRTMDAFTASAIANAREF